jgi:hypothetical protein
MFLSASVQLLVESTLDRFGNESWKCFVLALGSPKHFY